MEFGIEKICHARFEKWQMTYDWRKWNYQITTEFGTLEDYETYKYLGILEADTIKQVQMKDMIQKEYIRRTGKLLETKLSSRNLIKGINTWAVPLVIYSGHLSQVDPRGT